MKNVAKPLKCRCEVKSCVREELGVVGGWEEVGGADGEVSDMYVVVYYWPNTLWCRLL